MKNSLEGLGCSSLLVFLLVSVSAQSATVVAPRKPAARIYDATKEISLEGNVTSVNEALPGKLPGGHMLVATSKGTIDGNLGPFALRGVHRISVAAGAHVKLVGVMTSIKGNEVFLVRKIEAGGVTFTIRNAHGFPALTGARQPDKKVGLFTGGPR